MNSPISPTDPHAEAETEHVAKIRFAVSVPSTVSAENWYLASARRVFCEYILPTLPILPQNDLSNLFGSTVHDSHFNKILRIVTVAATAPFVAPRSHYLIGFTKRRELIQYYYNYAEATLLSHAQSLSPLQNIQIALLLSFCARRHAGITAPDTRSWFSVALATVQDLMIDQSSMMATPLAKRIWWTCWLYQQLDALDSRPSNLVPAVSLDKPRPSPLHLEDFDLSTSLLCWEEGGISGSRLDVASNDHRLASIFIEKIWLLQATSRCRCPKMADETCPSTPGSKSSDPLSDFEYDRSFWSAYQMQSDFEAWQNRTGATAADVHQSSLDQPNIAVHWTSLYYLFCRINIALYHITLNATNEPSQEATRMMHLLIEDRIARFYAGIMDHAQLLLAREQVRLAHATDPNIWLVFISAAKKLGVSDSYTCDSSQAVLDRPRSIMHGDSTTVEAFRWELLSWQSIPHPINDVPRELFHFLLDHSHGYATMSHLSNESEISESVPRCSSTSSEAACDRKIVVNLNELDAVDPWQLIGHLEYFLYNPASWL